MLSFDNRNFEDYFINSQYDLAEDGSMVFIENKNKDDFITEQVELFKKYLKIHLEDAPIRGEVSPFESISEEYKRNGAIVCPRCGSTFCEEEWNNDFYETKPVCVYCNYIFEVEDD